MMLSGTIVGFSAIWVIGRYWGSLHRIWEKEEASSRDKLLAFGDKPGGFGEGYAKRAEGCSPTCCLCGEDKQLACQKA